MASMGKFHNGKIIAFSCEEYKWAFLIMCRLWEKPQSAEFLNTG